MVASYTQLLQARYGEKLDEQAQEYIGYAVDGATRMQRLIEDLLAFSRLDNQAAPHDVIDLSLVLDGALRDLDSQIEESRAEVTRAPLPAVRGEASQLGQVFCNLLGNAMKFAGDAPPKIEVTATRQGDWWEVAVRDHGIGIPAADQERIFALFHRLHSTAQIPGSGIGLALCQRVVERHGGHIRVESAPGAGACFYFTLPAAGGEDA